MTAKPHVLTLAAGLLAVAVVAGCGGDTRRAETTGTTPSRVAGGPASTRVAVSANATDPRRRAYIARADRVCAQLDPRRAKERRRVGESPDPGEAVKAYDEGVSLAAQQLRRIEAVPVPPGDARLLRANVFDVLRQKLLLRRRIAVELNDADVPSVRRDQGELDALTQSLQGFARGYGFKVCGVR